MKYKVLFFILFQRINCLIINPAIGILTKSNIYLAQILEFNYTNDNFHLIYHHTDPIYPLQSLTSNFLLHRIYVCSPTTIYAFDLKIGSHLNPLVPIDDTPCRSSLTYIPSTTSLLWAQRNEILQLDFPRMSKEMLWNSTSSILQMIYNETIADDYIHFYISIQLSKSQSAILHCQSYHYSRINSLQSCTFLDYGYHTISALAVDKNFLYVADHYEHRIYILTIASNYTLLTRKNLPLNTSIIADVQSMFIYNHYLIWLTTSGHIRLVSLKTYEVRNLFWFDEQLQVIQLVSFSQWPNQTTTTTTTTTTITTTVTTVTTHTTRLSTSASEQSDTTPMRNEDNPWKTTTYITSIILGVALFLSAAMIACILLNYRIRHAVPHSFTNIFHILHRRTTVTSPQLVISDDLSV